MTRLLLLFTVLCISLTGFAQVSDITTSLTLELDQQTNLPDIDQFIGYDSYDQLYWVDKNTLGIKTNIENIGLESVGIATDRDKILVNDFYQTNIPGYYAIGDITTGQALAHVASAEGILCVEKIAGQHVEPLDYGNIPGCTYSSPEIASVGLTEAQAKEQGLDIKVGKFPFSASGKAQASGTPDGFIKVIFDAKYGEWLGCHMIGAGVTDMIAEAVLGRKLETTGHEVLKAVHPHPTMSEAMMEAVADAYDEVIHL